MPAETKLIAQTDIEAEQRKLSFLLMKLLFRIYNKKRLQIDYEPPVVTAYTPDETRLYDIWHEVYTEKTSYWIRVQHGDGRLIEFGRDAGDGTFFSDDEYNYLEVLYELRERHGKEELNTKTMSAMRELQNKNTKIALSKVTGWSQERIEVLKYLKGVLGGYKRGGGDI